MESVECTEEALEPAAKQATDRPIRETGPSRMRAIITVGLMLGMLIAAMEGTVVSTAMPTVIGDLHGIHLYPWVFSAYLLTSTATVPIYGKLADLFGRRRVFLIATATFLLGSMLSGAAHTMPQLIAFRAVQGLGAGGVLPLTLTLIGDLYTLRERARVQGLFTSMWGISSLAGPILGAVLTERLSWRWVFYVNLPFGTLSALLVGVYLREGANRAQASRPRIDIPGLLLLTASVVTLLILLLQIGTGESLFSPRLLALLVCTGALTFAFLRQERRAADPILPLSLFSHPVIAASTVGNVLIGVMIYGVDSYMPLFMQAVRGGNAHSASSVLTPLVLFWSLSAFVGAKALVRYGFRKTATFGVLCILTAALSLALLSPTTPTFVIIGTMMLLGTGLGPSSMAFLVSAQNAVSWEERGVVTAAAQFFRNLSATVGVGALGAVLNARLTASLANLPGGRVSPNALLNPHARATIPPAALHAIRHTLAGGLHLVFALMALLALVCFVAILSIARKPEIATLTQSLAHARSPEPEPVGGA